MIDKKWLGTCWTCKNVNSTSDIKSGGYTVGCSHNRYEHRVWNTHEDYKECEHYIKEIVK